MNVEMVAPDDQLSVKPARSFPNHPGKVVEKFCSLQISPLTLEGRCHPPACG
jgi:hypothetical protein